jgi:hypothetical protein
MSEVNVLDDKVVTLQYTIQHINALINAMNQPFGTPVMAWANFINDIHMQVGPQVQKINEELEKQNEPAA